MSTKQECEREFHLEQNSTDADTLIRHIRDHCYVKDAHTVEYIADHIDDYLEHKRKS